jgi:hypothetical protein
MASPALALHGADGAVVIALLIAVVIGLAYDKRVAAVFVAVLGCGVRAVARHRRRLMALARRAAAPASPCCGWRSPISTGPAR